MAQLPANTRPLALLTPALPVICGATPLDSTKVTVRFITSTLDQNKLEHSLILSYFDNIDSCNNIDFYGTSYFHSGVINYHIYLLFETQSIGRLKV